MDKSGIRNLGRLLRKDAKKEGFGKAAYGFLSNVPEYKNASVVMIYLSLEKEAPTGEIIKAVLADGKKVCVPVTEGQRITPCEFSFKEDLVKGNFGVMEPKTRKTVREDEIDICVIPGLLFDVRGTRCGYGKGCYDTFLESIETVKVGLAFSSQVIEAFPSESHDVKMHYIVTEKEVICCGEE